jgi:hypothetical protein
MRWSQLRKQVEDRFAPSMRGRVALHTAHYRHAHDSDGRAWIQLDGQEIATMCYFQARNARWELAEQLREASEMSDKSESLVELRNKAVGITRQAEVFSQQEFYRTLHEFLQLPIEAAISSENPILRALSVLDSRVGKRRLRRLADGPENSALVKLLLETRLQAEGMADSSKVT